MNTAANPDPREDSTLRDQAKRIVEQGKDIRHRIEALVRQGNKQLKAGSHKLADIAQEVMDGAIAGVRDVAPPDDRANRLRQVIDGLGDGFTATANAAKLAFEEAAAHGRHFARQDVKQIRDDLRSLSDQFVEVVSRTTRHVGDVAQSEWQDMVTHARRTTDHVKPAFQQALDAAKEDPVELARETSQAVVQASRQAAGALLGAMGTLLQQAADRVAHAPASKKSTPTTHDDSARPGATAPDPDHQAHGEAQRRTGDSV